MNTVATIVIPEAFAWLVVVWLIVGLYRSIVDIMLSKKIERDVQTITRNVFVTRLKRQAPPGVYEVTWKTEEKHGKTEEV